MAIYSEFSHEKWWFSIVMLVYQRVAMMRLAVVSTTCRNKLLAMSGYVPISKALEKYGATTEVQGNGIWSEDTGHDPVVTLAHESVHSALAQRTNSV